MTSSSDTLSEAENGTWDDVEEEQDIVFTPALWLQRYLTVNSLIEKFNAEASNVTNVSETQGARWLPTNGVGVYCWHSSSSINKNFVLAE